MEPTAIRPRRRPVRHRLGSRRRGRLARAQRLRPRAAGAHRRQGAARAGRHDPALLAVRLDACRAASTAGSQLHAKFGRLPLAERAGAGHPLRRGGLPALAGDRLRLGARRARASRTSRASPRSSCPAAARPREGEIFRNPALARTLRLLADKGRDAYYRGPIADGARALLARARRLLRAARTSRAHTLDVGRARSRRTTAATTVWELPPQRARGSPRCSCSTCSRAYDLKAMGRESADFWHVLVEAKKLAFADRARYYADPAFAKVPVAELLSKEYATRRAGARSTWRTPRSTDCAGDPAALSRRETTYLCAADEQRHDGLAHPEQLHRLRLGLRDARRSASASRTAATCSPCSPATRTRWSRASGPFHTIIPAFVTKDGAAAAWPSA